MGAVTCDKTYIVLEIEAKVMIHQALKINSIPSSKPGIQDIDTSKSIKKNTKNAETNIKNPATTIELQIP